MAQVIPTLWGEYEVKILPDDTCEHRDDNRRWLTIQEVQPDGFKRVIVMSGAYRCSKDYRKDDTSHGIGAVSMTFLLAGPKGAVQWHIGTDWYTRSTPLSQTEAVRREPTPRGWGIDYHSRTPMFAGQQSRGPYKYLDGADCYTDGTSLNAGQFMPDFLTHPGAVWDALRDDYNSRFNA